MHEVVLRHSARSVYSSGHNLDGIFQILKTT